MNRTFEIPFIFMGGVIAGSAVTAVILKKKYNDILEEEVASLKKTFELNSHHEDEEPKLTEEEVIVTNPESKADISAYRELANKYKEEYEDEEETGGDDGEPVRFDVEKLKQKKNPRIYEIDESEYGEESEYDTIECTYYADEILADDDDGVIDNVRDAIGDVMLDALDEENSVMYVRNEKRRIDYAISYDPRDYEYAQTVAHRVH